MVAHPELIDMEHFCGTAFCIGGHICKVIGRADLLLPAVGFNYRAPFDVKLAAAEALGMDAYSTEIDRLFYPQCWPQSFWDDYHRAKTPKDRAKVVSDRIELWIESGGES